MKAESWRDILPANLPLEYGVPVVGVSITRRPLAGLWLDDSYLEGDEEVHVVNIRRLGSVLNANTEIIEARIDLDTAIGFGYALRLLGPRVAELPITVAFKVCYLRDAIVERWMLGTPTDADRLALARALADLF